MLLTNAKMPQMAVCCNCHLKNKPDKAFSTQLSQEKIFFMTENLAKISNRYRNTSTVTPRVEALHRLAQVAPVQVCIDLGSGYALVAHHLLHGAQVGPGLYQVRSKRVA